MTTANREQQTIEPGIYYISSEEYHSGPGISRSNIMDFKRSPYHYWYRKINPDYVSKSTPAMEFGTAFHTFILEPEEFVKNYFVMLPNPHDGRTAFGKEFKATQVLEAAGKIPLCVEDMEKITKMAAGLYSHDKAKALVENKNYEASIYWIDEASGLLCKARPDIMDENIVVDLKTAADISPRAFNQAFYKYGNYIQCSMIKDGIKAITGNDIKQFLNLAVETVEPYAPALYPVVPEYVDAGGVEYKDILIKIKECLEKNSWPSYADNKIEIPNYYQGTI